MTDQRTVWLDVSETIGEQASLAATYYPVATSNPIVLVCLPGGTYNRAYWHLDVPGHPGYNFAEYAAGRGYAVVAIDPLGTGDSSKPARDIGLQDIATALTHALSVLPEITGSTTRPVALAHSLGGYLAILQQAAGSCYAGLGILGCTNQYVAPLNLDQNFIAAALVDVPVLLGYGEVDVSPDPGIEARFYARSTDITTLAVPGSGHCHNMASTRHVLWQQLLEWAGRIGR